MPQVYLAFGLHLRERPHFFNPREQISIVGSVLGRSLRIEEAKFTPGANNEVFKMMGTSGAQLTRATPGTVIDWHTAPRRQYVITLSGQGEIEVAGGKKLSIGPGEPPMMNLGEGESQIVAFSARRDNGEAIIRTRLQHARRNQNVFAHVL